MGNRFWVIAAAMLAVAAYAIAQESAIETLQRSFGPTADELKEMFDSPMALFLAMLLGSAVSMLNQLGRAKRDGAAVTLGQYLSHWPELLAALLNNVLAWVVLLMTDQLNFASAVGIGFAANSLADQYRSKGGGRAKEIADATPLQPPPSS